ncbi:MAG: hypothetical protein A2Y25_02705 [Candidatus Melainabacteria bacterium GWF2_37_15]|nr:MAG: hypothetical protein A2Y25_02705 [Candidatus Melainabacteria bacterium GWF2_37_15]
MISAVRPSLPLSIAIVDDYDCKDIDVNGDFCPDITHGEDTETTLTSNLRVNHVIRRFSIPCNSGNEKLVDNTLLQTFNELESPENKDIKYVNMSLAEEIRFDKLKRKYDKYLKDNNLPGEELTPDNIVKNRKTVIDVFGEKVKPALKSIIQKLENVAKTKNIFIAQHNIYTKDSLEFVDSEPFAKGIISVGSETQKRQRPEFNFPGTTYIYAKGNYKTTPVLKNGTVIGFDRTEDGKMDIPISKITGHEIIEQFAGSCIKEGANIKDVEATDVDYERLKQYIDGTQPGKEKEYLSAKLFSIDKLHEKGIMWKQESLVKKGTHLDLNTVLTFSDSMSAAYSGKEVTNPSLVFKVKKNGKVVYNPCGKKGVISEIDATSLATPTALAQHINKLYA